MLHLVSGVPGAGKTLRAIWLAQRILAEQPDRPLFSNINGWKAAAEIPERWMDCPTGALIVLDECQQRWRRYNANGRPPEEIAELETHRHHGVDFILTCQNPKQLSVDVRSLVDTHEHLTRKGGFGMAFVHRWQGRCVGDPSSQFKSADVETETWKHPKEIYGQYKSAEVHTVRKKIPKAVKIFAGALVTAVFLIAFAFQQVSAYLQPDDEPTESPGQTSDTSQPQPQKTTVLAVGGIVSHNESRCRLIDSDGNVIPVTLADCLNAYHAGLPRSVQTL